MFKYCNPHPKNKHVGDCVKRAITIATEYDYSVISRLLNRYKKVTGSQKYNDAKNCKQFIEKELNGQKLSFPAIKGTNRMDGYKFCNDYPEGIYILRMAGHLTCCKNGVIYDTWDCRNKCIYNAWKID